MIVRYGTPGLIGRGIEGVIANNLFKISPIEAAVTDDFLAFFLSQRSIQDYLSSQGSGLVCKDSTGCRDEGAARSVLSKLERRAELAKAEVLSKGETAMADHFRQYGNQFERLERIAETHRWTQDMPSIPLHQLLHQMLANEGKLCRWLSSHRAMTMTV